MSDTQVMTVSEFNRVTDNCLKQLGVACVTGEISECRAYAHLYFKLKDELSTVDCLMFSSVLQSLPFKPEVGQQVVVTGQSSLYSKNGQFKLLVRSMQMAGRGLIMERLKKLEERLRNEGVFDLLHRPLPRCPDTVGIITSLEGRVVHDISMTLKRRCPGIALRIYDAKVQGEGAAQSLMQALDLANAECCCDVLIIGRGGGSFEDLLAFSDEALVRAVARSKIPIVSAVGHEPDVALSDFAVDVRAATPTAAAELVSQVTRDDCHYSLMEYARRLDDAVGRFVDPYRMRYENLITRLEAAGPGARLELATQRASALTGRLDAALGIRLSREDGRLKALLTRLFEVNPQKHVERLGAKVQTLILRCDGALKVNMARREREAGVLTSKLLAFSPERLITRISTRMHDLSGRLDTAALAVLEARRSRIRSLYLKLEGMGIIEHLDGCKRQLVSDSAKLQALNPLQVLVRGYSVALNSQGHQATASGVKRGDELTILTSDGRIFSKVEGSQVDKLT